MMMKKIQQISIIFFIAFQINAQEVIKIEPDWSNFKTQEFEIETIKYEEKNGSVVKNDSSTYLGEWSYKEFKKNEHLLIWTMKNDFLPNQKHNKYIDRDLEVIYSANDSGEFVEIKNWSSIKKYFKLMTKEIKSTMDNKLAYKLVKLFYKDKTYLLNIVGKEIDALHRIYGFDSIGEKEIISYKEDTYNAIVKDPVQTNVKIYIESKTEHPNHIVFKKEKKYDPKSTKEIAMKVLEKLSNKEEDKMEENLENMKIDLQKNERLEYNYKTNAPIRIELEQKNIMALGIENGLKIKKTILRKIR